MLLYTCDGSGIDSFTDEQLRGSECLTGGTGTNDPKLACIRGNLVGAWAVGGTVSGISDYLIISDCKNAGPDVYKLWSCTTLTKCVM